MREQSSPRSPASEGSGMISVLSLKLNRDCNPTGLMSDDKAGHQQDSVLSFVLSTIDETIGFDRWNYWGIMSAPEDH